MKIDDFVAKIGYAGGLSRTNRYTVELTLPRMVDATKSSSDLQMMHLFCEAVQLPSLNVNTAQNRTFGETREIPYEFHYDPVNFTFYVDSNLKIKYMFDQWIKCIQTGDARTFNYYDNYICPQLKIDVQNLEDKSVHRVILHEAYPKSISQVSLGYDSKEVMKLTVNIVYKYWTSYSLAYQEVPPVKVPKPVETRTITNTVTEQKIDYIGNPMGDLSGYGNGW